MTETQYNKERCVSSEACVKACRKKSVTARKLVNYKVERNADKCIGCVECVLACPAGAWARGSEKLYRLTIMGRTGNKNPRLGEDFIKWIDEAGIIKIILNTYDYVTKYIDPSVPGGKEHIGYIID